MRNVDYSSEPHELKEHFAEMGEILKITIPVNKFNCQPKGYAFLEFETKESSQKAIELLNDSLFKGRQLTVISKRKNLPGRGRGGGFPRYPRYPRYPPSYPYMRPYRPYMQRPHYPRPR